MREPVFLYFVEGPLVFARNWLSLVGIILLFGMCLWICHMTVLLSVLLAQRIAEKRSSESINHKRRNEIHVATIRNQNCQSDSE